MKLMTSQLWQNACGFCKSKKNLLSSIAVYAYLVLLGLNVFSNIIYASYLGQSFLNPFLALLATYLTIYLIPALFAVFLLDVFANGINYKKVLFGVAGALLVRALSTVYYEQSIIYFFWFALAYPNKCKIRHVARSMWISGLIAVVLVVSFQQLGIIQGIVEYRGETPRYALGFASANGFAVTVTCFILLLTYDLSWNWRWWFIPILLAPTIAVYFATNGRMALLVGVMYLVCIAIYKSGLLKGGAKSIVERVVFIASKWSYPVCAAFCLIVTFVWSAYPGRFGFSLYDKLITLRATEMVMFYDTYGIGLLGQEVRQIEAPEVLATGKSLLVLDNAYILYAIKYGAIIFLAIILLFVGSARHAQKNADVALAAYILLMAAFGVSEVIPIQTARSLMVFCVGAWLASNQGAAQDVLGSKTSNTGRNESAGISLETATLSMKD